jgi:hypothetical protein
LLIELVELIDPADGVVGLGLAVGEIDDRGVAKAWVVLAPCEFGDGPGVRERTVPSSLYSRPG